MGTTNYDFTYLEGANAIDLVGDTTTFLDEIDGTIKEQTDDVKAEIGLKSFDLTGKTAIFLGDSITYGQATSTGGQVATTYPKQFGNVTGATVTNIAVGGATAASGSPATSNALAQASSVSAEYDYLFMMFGTNDYGYAIDPGSVNALTENTSCKGIYDAFCNIQQRFPNTKIIGIIGPYMDGDFVKNSIGKTALDYKSNIYQVYAKFNIPVVDFTHGLGYNANNWNSHLMDWDVSLTRLHPNQATYIEIGDYLAKCLSVNSFGGYVFNHRNMSGESITLGTGTSVAGSSVPLAWYDEMTGMVNIDMGEALTIGEGFATNLGSFSTVPAPFRNLYFAATLLHTDGSTSPTAVGFSTSKTLDLVGTGYQTGDRVLGCCAFAPCMFTTNY